MNILKLLILVPFIWVVSVFFAGDWWPVAMAIFLVAGACYFRAEQMQKRRKAYLEQQVVMTRQNLDKAQAEAERLQRKADMEEAVQGAINDTKRQQWFEGQWN